MEKPIVAADSEGPKWLIRHGENGLLCPKNDPDALAEEVKSMLSDRSRTARMVAAGKAEFEGRFTQDAILNQYRLFFREILAARDENRPAELSYWQT